MIKIIEYRLDEYVLETTSHDNLNALLENGYAIIGHCSYRVTERFGEENQFQGDSTNWERFTLYKADNVQKVDSNALTLAVITSIEGGLTKNNQRPMWRCQTDIGEKVNIFLNVDEPEKDNFNLFEAAGFGDFLKDIGNFETLDCQIFVAMQKNGQWWEIVKVSPYRPQMPELPF